MMQAVSQSYTSQIYTQIQNGSRSSDNRTEAGRAAGPPYSSSLQQSTDDSIALSTEGKELSKRPVDTTQSSADGKDLQTARGTTQGQEQQLALTQEELKAITELQKRDTEVRTHEQAHLSAAGQYAAGGASFSYTTGPNGKRYASGGEVPIDIAKEKTPEATIQKMRTVRRAALAPASPSGADRSIAAQASSKEAQAMKELQDQVVATAPDQTTSGENTTKEIQEDQSSTDSITTPQVSDFSRRSMTSAYQAMAAFAS